MADDTKYRLRASVYLDDDTVEESEIPVSLVLCWRNMTTEYSSPYKVGLIDVGTKFAQSRLAWSGIAYGKWNFHGNVVSVKRFVANATLHHINQPK